MTTRCLIPIVACACLVTTARAARGAEEDKRVAHVEFKILQVDPHKPAGAGIIAAWNAEVARSRTHAEQKTEPPAAATPPTPTPDQQDAAFAVLVCDADKLLGDVFTNNEAASAAGSLISAPRLVAYVGQEASVSIGRQVPYMVPRDDGSLVVAHSDDLLEGVFADVKVSQVTEPGAAGKAGAPSDTGAPGKPRDASAPPSPAAPTCVVDFHLKLSSVTGRQPLADVPFDVGLPIISSRETLSTLRVTSGADVIMRLPQPNPDDQPIFVVLTVKILDQPEP